MIRVATYPREYDPRRTSSDAPTVLIRPDGSPENQLARILTSAFGAERISKESAEKLRQAGLNVEIHEPPQMHRIFRRTAP